MDTEIDLSGVARLGYLGCIRVAGPDAAAFLHSQLTNDVTSLAPNRARLAGFCSAKGRLLASFIVWQNARDEVMLVCAADLLDATLKRLSMFVLRSRCQLSNASAEWLCFGLAGSVAQARVGDLPPWGRVDVAGAAAIRLPGPTGQTLALWVAPAGAAAPPGPTSSESHWRWLLLQAGVPTIEASTRELFVPQMVNLELLAGVDFQKGCYPGQEIVARSQYRGTLKRRMFLFDCDAAAAPAGTEIFTVQDPHQPAGLVVNSAPRPAGTGTSLLAEIKLAHAAEPLHLGDVHGALLHRRPLPYAVPLPVDAAA